MYFNSNFIDIGLAEFVPFVHPFVRFGQLSSYGAIKKSTTNPMTDRTTDRPAGQTARNWFLIGCMAVGGDATLEQTKQFACYCPVLGSSEWLVIVSASATFCLCLFSLRRGGERGDKEHNNSTAELHFYYFCQKKTRNPKKKNDPSKPRNCIELSLNCL